MVLRATSSKEKAVLRANFTLLPAASATCDVLSFACPYKSWTALLTWSATSAVSSRASLRTLRIVPSLSSVMASPLAAEQVITYRGPQYRLAHHRALYIVTLRESSVALRWAAAPSVP